MKKITIVYWSGTGNTQMMAAAVAEGAKEAGAEINLISAEEAGVDIVKDADAIALGCPSMGSEQLEECIMEPFMCDIDGLISGKNVALFGSYGWGSGEWMQDWEERVRQDGATIVDGEGVITNGTPDDDCLEKCKDIGNMLAK